MEIINFNRVPIKKESALSSNFPQVPIWVFNVSEKPGA